MHHHHTGHVKSPLYVITTVFNPRRFQSRVRLYHAFAQWVRDSGVKLLTVEIAFGERTHAVTAQDDPWHLQLFTRQELWHKERALNLGLQRLRQLAPGCRYVSWMDADTRIARTDWAEETVHLLQHYAVIQMFSHQTFLGPNYEPVFTCPSVAKTFRESGLILDKNHHPGAAGVDKLNPYLAGGHPGLAWAFRCAELNDIGGWLDICANGSGDLHMANCYAGHWDMAVSRGASPGYRAAIQRYGRLCDRHIKRNLGVLDGNIDHYFHGRSQQRGYEARIDLLDKFAFSPESDLIPSLDGLYRWDLGNPRVHALATEIRKSLAKRNEDATEL